MKDVIKNIENLSAVFECEEVPSFHDAEIVSIFFNRESSVSIETILRVYRQIEKYRLGDKNFARWKNAYCTFRFDGAAVENLRGFNHQNVINDLKITREENSENFDVHFQSMFGCDLKFRCREIELTRVRVSESVKESLEPNLEELKKRFNAAKNSENKD